MNSTPLSIILTVLILSSCNDTSSVRYPWMDEIDTFTTQSQIDNYWDEIDAIDNSKRGAQSIDSLDNDNFKKVIYMIEQHGYPNQNITPNLVLTHQSSCDVMEHYFPIFHNAFLTGKADTFWFLHNVRGLHRCRYARDFKEVTADNYLEIIERTAPDILSANPRFDLSEFDKLYNNYRADIAYFTGNKIVRQWINKENDTLRVYQKNEDYYLHKIWRDNTYAFPQPVIVTIDSVLTINFVNSWNDLHYKTNGNKLYQYAENEIKDTYVEL